MGEATDDFMDYLTRMDERLADEAYDYANVYPVVRQRPCRTVMRRALLLGTALERVLHKT